MMKLDIRAGIVWLTDKPHKKEQLRKFCDEFGPWADIDFCVDESDEYECCFVGTYDKGINTIDDMRYMYKRFKSEIK